MRIQVNLDDDYVKLLDELAKDIGLSRSRLCAVYILTSMRRELNFREINEIEKKEP